MPFTTPDQRPRRLPRIALTAAVCAAAGVLSGPALAQAAVEAAAAAAPSSNPYGLDALWAQGDVVAKGTLLILLAFSLGSWYVLATKLFQSARLAREAKAARATVLQADSLLAGARALKAGGTFRYIADTALAAEQQYFGAVSESIDRNEWINASLQQAVDDVQARQQEGLAFLATVGATAPFIGLFGTVWGIYHALTAIGVAGQASIDKVAGPVGEALIMTAIGLAVAVPAVLGYNWLVRRNKVLLDAARRFGSDLHRLLLGAKPLAPTLNAGRGAPLREVHAGGGNNKAPQNAGATA